MTRFPAIAGIAFGMVFATASQGQWLACGFCVLTALVMILARETPSHQDNPNVQ